MTQYQTSKEVQSRYKISRSTLFRWQGCPKIEFPKPIKIGRRILWRMSDLNAFDDHIRGETTSNSDEAPSKLKGGKYAL